MGTSWKRLLALEVSAFGFFGLFAGCYAVLLADLSGALGHPIRGRRLYAKSMKPKEIGVPVFSAYVVVTLLAIAASTFVAIANFLRLKFVLSTASKVGVSESWMTTLGILNAAAALGLLFGLLSGNGPCPSRCSSCLPQARTSSCKSPNRARASAHRGPRPSWPAREAHPGPFERRPAHRQCQL
jgi:DoxX-like family